MPMTSNSATTIDDGAPAKLTLPHPGEVLRGEFLEPMGLSVYALAKAIGVPRSRINEIVHARQGITAAHSPAARQSFLALTSNVHEHARRNMIAGCGERWMCRGS